MTRTLALPPSLPVAPQELLPKLFAQFATPTNTDVETLAGAYGGAMFTVAPGAAELSTLDMDGYRALVGCVFPAGIPGMEAADAAKGFVSSAQPGALAPSVQRLAVASYVSVRATLQPRLQLECGRMTSAASHGLTSVWASCTGDVGQGRHQLADGFLAVQHRSQLGGGQVLGP